MFDVSGAVIESRDARGALVLRSYDILGGLSRVRARDDADVGSVTLRERLEYGDACDPN